MILPCSKTYTRQLFIDMFAASWLLLGTNIKDLWETSFDGPHAGDSQVLSFQGQLPTRTPVPLGSYSTDSVHAITSQADLDERIWARERELMKKLLDMKFYPVLRQTCTSSRPSPQLTD